MAFGSVNIPGISETARGAPNGVASLDANGKVPVEQLPSMNFIPTSEKAAPNGVASLGADGKVPGGQLPEMAYLPLTGGTLTGALTIGKMKLSWNAATASLDFEVVS